MKGRVVLLDQIGGRNAAALMLDGRLEDFALDPVADEALPGAIFRAVADRPMKGQGGLFVKLPDGRGFLRQTGGIAPGQRLIVQVSGPAEEGKALPVTTRLLFQVALRDRHPWRAGAEHQPPDQGRGHPRRAGTAGRRGHGGRRRRPGPNPAVGLRRGRAGRRGRGPSPRCAAWPRR